MSTTFTVIIPTYDHVETIKYSVDSILNQTFQDFEIVVIGDGAPEETKEILEGYIKRDDRIKYFSYPKGEGHGETYRHKAILKSESKYIAYLCDDDIWLPEHLYILKMYLERYDFVNTIHTAVMPDGRIDFLSGSLSDKQVRKKMLDKEWNFFGPTCVAHRLVSYNTLPFGWRPRPDGIWSDLYMWRQWLNQEDLRFYTIPVSTTLHFASPLRVNMSIKKRVEELNNFWMKLDDEFNFIELNRRLIHSFLAQGERSSTNRLIHQEARDDKRDMLVEHVELTFPNLYKRLIELQTEYEIKNRDYINLKSAKSTKLGFMLSYPIRKILDVFRK